MIGYLKKRYERREWMRKLNELEEYRIEFFPLFQMKNILV